MTSRTNNIIKVLAVSLLASLLVASAKIIYGTKTHTLAFLADGIHSLFDSASTLVGIISVIFSSKPPDEGHPYGHQKMETVAAMLLAFFLFLAAYEVGGLAYTRLQEPNVFPEFSFAGVLILIFGMTLNLGIGMYEAKKAKVLNSQFLVADAIHNKSDFMTGLAVLASLLSVKYRVPYVDAGCSVFITLYLVYLSVKLIWSNIHPLVDSKVLDAKSVQDIANGVEGVLHCHQIRSRGEKDHYFLDLNIHLPGTITLEKAHQITHEVESRLKTAFPGLVDVVIHTEPHGHPPCEEGE